MVEGEGGELLDPKAVARRIGWSYWRTLRLLKAGALPYVRLGSRFYVKRQALENWLRAEDEGHSKRG